MLVKNLRVVPVLLYSLRLSMKVHKERIMPGMTTKANYQEYTSRYKFALHHVQGKTVIDLGCGTGYGSAILARQARYVIGVDIDQEAIKYAKENYNSSNMEFLRGDCVRLNLNKKFDIAVAMELIEHLDENEQHAMLKCVSNHLKSNGTFIASTPNKETYTLKLDFHKRELNREEFQNMISKHFRNVKILGQGIEEKGMRKTILSRPWLRKVIPRWLKDFYNNHRPPKQKFGEVENPGRLICICTKPK